MSSGSFPPSLSGEQKAERRRQAEINGAAARADYEAASRSADEKTARLRALRLEREKETASTKPAAPARAPAKRKALRRHVPM